MTEVHSTAGYTRRNSYFYLNYWRHWSWMSWSTGFSDGFQLLFSCSWSGFFIIRFFTCLTNTHTVTPTATDEYSQQQQYSWSIEDDDCVHFSIWVLRYFLEVGLWCLFSKVVWWWILDNKLDKYVKLMADTLPWRFILAVEAALSWRGLIWLKKSCFSWFDNRDYQ